MRHSWLLLVDHRFWNAFFSHNTKEWIDWNPRKSIGKAKSKCCASLFGFGAWLIWPNKNQKVFEQSDTCVLSLIWPTSHLVDEYQSSLIKIRPMQRNFKTEQIGWVFPGDDILECNVDGSCRDGGMKTRCGGVLRDATGLWIAGFTNDIGQGRVLMVELWRMIKGLQMAQEKGERRLCLEADSKVAIQLVQSGVRA